MKAINLIAGATWLPFSSYFLPYSFFFCYFFSVLCFLWLEKPLLQDTHRS